MMFDRRKVMRAMKAADGEGDTGGTDRSEVEAFEGLSKLVRSAESHQGEPPPFDAMWSGVEEKAGQLEKHAQRGRPDEGRSTGSTLAGFLGGLFGDRPILALAPAGALVLAAVLGALWLLSPVRPSNECFVDSYDVGSGSVLVDQVFDDPQRPTVIWYTEEG